MSMPDFSSAPETAAASAPPPDPAPVSALGQRIRDALGIDIHEVTGAVVSGEIPLARGVINRLIAAQLSGDAPVSSATIQPHDGDRFTAHVRLRARLIPQLTLSIRIETQPELPERPVLGLRWSMPGLGPLALFAAPALAFFKSLPRGIRAHGDWIGVDIHELMRSQGLDDLVPYLAGLRVTTRQDRVIVRFEVRT